MTAYRSASRCTPRRPALGHPLPPRPPHQQTGPGREPTLLPATPKRMSPGAGYPYLAINFIDGGELLSGWGCRAKAHHWQPGIGGARTSARSDATSSSERLGMVQGVRRPGVHKPTQNRTDRIDTGQQRQRCKICTRLAVSLRHELLLLQIRSETCNVSFVSFAGLRNYETSRESANRCIFQRSPSNDSLHVFKHLGSNLRQPEIKVKPGKHKYSRLILNLCALTTSGQKRMYIVIIA